MEEAHEAVVFRQFMHFLECGFSGAIGARRWQGSFCHLSLRRTTKTNRRRFRARRPLVLNALPGLEKIERSARMSLWNNVPAEPGCRHVGLQLLKLVM
jgi:hypothetical protein